MPTILDAADVDPALVSIPGPHRAHDDVHGETRETVHVDEDFHVVRAFGRTRLLPVGDPWGDDFRDEWVPSPIPDAYHVVTDPAVPLFGGQNLDTVPTLAEALARIEARKASMSRIVGA